MSRAMCPVWSLSCHQLYTHWYRVNGRDEFALQPNLVDASSLRLASTRGCLDVPLYTLYPRVRFAGGGLERFNSPNNFLTLRVIRRFEFLGSILTPAQFKLSSVVTTCLNIRQGFL